MRLLLFSDLHLDSVFAWAGGRSQAARKRREALRSTLQRILALAEERKIDALLCGGDLYEHDHFTPDTVEFLRSALAKINPLPVFIAPGNHDWFGPKSIYRMADWSPNVHVFKDPKLEPVALVDGITLWGAAHCSPSGTQNFLKDFRVDRDGVHLALFHGSERRGLKEQGMEKAGHAPFDEEEIPRSGLNHAFLGHYHRPRDGEWHTYPGNPDPLSFGEDGNRGPVLATISPDGQVGRERISVAVTSAHDREIDISGCNNRQEILDRISSALDGLTGVARVTLVGELGADVDIRTDHFQGEHPTLDAVLVRFGDLRVGYEIDAISKEPTVRGQFVRDVLASNLSPDSCRKVLMTGLRALDGRDDLEVP